MGFLGACSFAFVGCGDDEPAGDGGSNGAGKGGTAGKGGSAGKGGASGTSGTSGTAGSAARGGTAGRGGSAGQGGTAGSSGSAGQDIGGAGGDGGVGGEGGESGGGGAGTGPGGAGAGGEGGTPDTTADSCNYECMVDNDCAVGANTAYKCHLTRKRCERPELACDTHQDCTALASQWTFACANDSECTPLFEACIDVGGRGLCAFTPYPTCFTGVEMPMPRFGAAGTITVCGSDAGRCDDQNRCFTGCSDSPTTICSLANGRGTTCNATTGLCECTADVQCSADGVSTCNMTTHQCECVDNDDCTVMGADECVSGRCGCSSAGECPATTFPLATAVCE
jgi:hypothetical protein